LRFSRYLHIFLFVSLLPLVACTSFIIPKEITKQDLAEMLNAVEIKDKKHLVSVIYLSETRPDQMPMPKTAGKIPRVNDDYGVRLYFSERACKGGTGYIFIRESGKWIRESNWYTGPARSCP